MLGAPQVQIMAVTRHVSLSASSSWLCDCAAPDKPVVTPKIIWSGIRLIRHIGVEHIITSKTETAEGTTLVPTRFRAQRGRDPHENPASLDNEIGSQLHWQKTHHCTVKALVVQVEQHCHLWTSELLHSIKKVLCLCMGKCSSEISLPKSYTKFEKTPWGPNQEKMGEVTV